MKILVTLTYYRPYISGLTNYAHNLASGLAHRRHQVTVLTMRYSPDLANTSQANGLRIIRAETLFKISKSFISLDWLWQSYQQVKINDVVIINLPQPEAVVTACFAKIFHKKIIVVYHCDVTLNNKLIEIILDLFHKIILNLAQNVVTNTRDYALASRILPKYLSKTAYIYPVINQIQAQSDRHPIFTIGWIGRMAREKGLEYLFQAIPILVPKMKFKIAIAGPQWTVGEENYRKKIESLSDKYKDYVEFLGQLADTALNNFYNKIDILVLPSINSTETLGLVQLEAMSAGVPVVASDLPGVRQPIVQTGMGLLVPPGNSEKLAQAIYKIYKNYKFYNGNRDKPRQLFAPQNSLNAFEHLILS